MAKLELIYNALSERLPDDVDTFWEGCDRFKSSKERTIDIDNLQGLVIYLVWQLKQPKLLIDCFLINEFASLTTINGRRMGFVNYVKASIDFLLETNFDTK